MILIKNSSSRYTFNFLKKSKIRLNINENLKTINTKENLRFRIKLLTKEDQE